MWKLYQRWSRFFLEKATGIGDFVPSMRDYVAVEAVEVLKRDFELFSIGDFGFDGIWKFSLWIHTPVWTIISELSQIEPVNYCLYYFSLSRYSLLCYLFLSSNRNRIIISPVSCWDIKKVIESILWNCKRTKGQGPLFCIYRNKKYECHIDTESIAGSS